MRAYVNEMAFILLLLLHTECIVETFLGGESKIINSNAASIGCEIKTQTLTHTMNIMRKITVAQCEFNEKFNYI